MRIVRTLCSAAALLTLAASVSLAQGKTKGVTCSDGTASKGGQGACSGHGGIAAAKIAGKADAKALKTSAKADVKVAKTEAKADAKIAKTEAKADAKVAQASSKATATCKDGTHSYAKDRAGACSGHGGVKAWASDAKKK